MPYDDLGREIPDPTPVAMPSGVGRPEPLHETIKRMVRVQLSDYARNQGKETFEESLDFDIPEDETLTEHEKRATMVEEYLEEFQNEQMDIAVKSFNQQKEQQRGKPDDRTDSDGKTDVQEDDGKRSKE